jgi:hypothetical protein
MKRRLRQLAVLVALAVCMALVVLPVKPALAGTCREIKGTPRTDGNYVYATAAQNCYGWRNVVFNTVEVRIMQYRGAGIWSQKAIASNSVDGAENLSVTARWNCAPGTGSQLYYAAIRFIHRDVGTNATYYNPDASRQARLVCN